MMKAGYMAVVLLVFVLGCRKDDALNNPGIPGTHPLVLRQLSFSNITTSSTLPPGPAQVLFSYDNAGRITHVLMYRGDTGIAVPSTDTLCEFRFYYSGTDSLPQSSVQRIRTTPGDMIEQFHGFTYNGNGQLVKDSVFSYVSFSHNLFYYRYGSDFGVSEVGPSPALTLRLDSFIVANGNMVSLYDDNIAGPPQPDLSYRFEYDTSINPLNKLNIASVFSSFAINRKRPFNAYLEDMLPIFGTNNTSEVKNYENGILVRTDTFWYTYNGDNLPVYRIWSHDNPTTVSDTLTFRYQ